MIKDFLHNTSLQRQLIISVLAICSFSMVTFSVLTGNFQKNLLIEEYDNATRAQLEAVRLGLEIGLTEENYNSIQTVISWAREDANFEFIAVYDEDRQLLGASPSERAYDFVSLNELPEDVDEADSIFVTKTTWETPLTGVGTIFIGYNTSYLEELQNKTAATFTLIILGLIAAILIIVIALAKNITRPLVRLKEVVENVKEDDTHHRANEHQGSPEVRVVAKSFNEMLEELISTQRKRLFEVERHSRTLSENNNKLQKAYISLEERSEQLSEEKERSEQAYKELQQAQVKLIESEKLAVLGQLVAGIAHEVNTPVGAINSAIEEVDKDFHITLKNLIHITDNLEDDEVSLYLEYSDKVIDFEKEMSTREQRKARKLIEEELACLKPEQIDFFSRKLSNVGFGPGQVRDILPLLNTEIADRIVESYYQLGMSQVHVRDIKIAVKRIAMLVKALKHYSRSDQEEKSSTNLKEDLENTLIILNNKLKQGIKVVKDLNPVPDLYCYPGRLNQVWTNLLHNAIQAMGGNGEIKLSLSCADKIIKVSVQDNGKGIPEESLERIFDPYFTTKEKGEGTGLGLSISRQIVEKHKGTISVSSVPGKTVFTVSIPVT